MVTLSSGLKEVLPKVISLTVVLSSIVPISVSTSLLFSLKVFFISIGFLILKANILMISSILISISTLSVILGVYLGYFIGYEHKVKSYLVGGTILILSGIYTIFRF